MVDYISMMEDRNVTVLKWLKIILNIENKLCCFVCTEKVTGKVFMEGVFTKPYCVCEPCQIVRNDLKKTVEVRNIYMEHARNKLFAIYLGMIPSEETTPCRYSRSGCEKRMKVHIEDHEKECLYQSKTCMFCSWKITYADLQKHVLREHAHLKIGNEVLINDVEKFRVILVRGEVFVLWKMMLLTGEFGYTVHHVTPKQKSEFLYDFMTLGSDDTLNLFTSCSCLAITMKGLRNKEYLNTTCVDNGIHVGNVDKLNVLIFPRKY